MTETTGAAEANVPSTWATIFDWARRFGVRPVPLGLAGWAAGMTAALDPRDDGARGCGHLLILAGPVSGKMAPLVRRLWDEMPEPKGSIVLGSVDLYGTYAVVRGLDGVIPVDVHVPGDPPRPEDLRRGLLRLQERMGLAEVLP